MVADGWLADLERSIELPCAFIFSMDRDIGDASAPCGSIFDIGGLRTRSISARSTTGAARWALFAGLRSWVMLPLALEGLVPSLGFVAVRGVTDRA